MAGDHATWCEVLAEIIDTAHLATADDLDDLVRAACLRAGIGIDMYLVDIPERSLRPLGPGEPIAVDDSPAGRAFQFTDIIADDEPGAVWAPMVDGTHRIGVALLRLPSGDDPEDAGTRARCWTLVGLLGHLVMAKSPYSDAFHRLRRTRPFTVAGELLGQLLPPRTFASQDLVVTAVMEPFDQAGGDGFDYAVDDHHAYLAVFDSTGHDLHAGLITTAVLAATRNARRGHADLSGIAAAADDVLRNELPTGGFSTAVLATVDLGTGTLRYLLAGHPPPVLLRDGHLVDIDTPSPRPPLGVRAARPTSGIGEVTLRPQDRVLLYTDGVTEARSPGNEFFGLDRLVALTERHEIAGLSPPETLRRIIHEVMDHQHGTLQDDATLMLLEWATQAPARLLPA
ncbi:MULTISPECIES: PP2C family protein-serine/threonine phosphatase [Actinokineospora]|uniref:PPM-type phosphatase domain-containing protein n=1 Tax=Actinokineospora fastidiosa TaxID=1816 RepID=A0A918GHW7_9PSEU|nr:MULTISPECIES: PP2C family protein-serine/threonine phosphatase [Actinokineospora]UVS80224.1 Phosphoserine phosphatase RsbU [Actinokineospora sp. UTMC 2448]GGS33829.1 hypothetical protein GCM10010171_30160 [Actinokineospora fastidiosa]